MLVILSSSLGMGTGLFFYSSYEKAVVKEAGAASRPQMAEVEGAIPLFLFVGTTIGFFLGVATWSFWYMKVKAEEKKFSASLEKARG